MLGVIFSPVAWLIGVPGKDIGAVGSLLGTRTVINELVAYSDLGAMKAALDPRSVTIATFALCGFANFSSIGIGIQRIGALAPNKRDELAKLGFRAMIPGTIGESHVGFDCGLVDAELRFLRCCFVLDESACNNLRPSLNFMCFFKMLRYFVASALRRAYN